ncbi:zeta toxin of the postsegregational killing system [Verminephrobacter aporrectodeae subsp. tuberculatae]|uniref:zeta toxin family protein n=1 Tax=Verminephrobacter aporrectodeae TaxID=1110389 RepID=UPI0022436917|nr:zeta toxin family protein [Verminephrobacter aporrectodeae]MCW8208086.1 zeta toxin of the postsegregational killing system [Verminephrobacter aporrectodeae subsp. tuberculatae]
MTLNPDKYWLSEERNQEIFENDIKPNIFALAKPSNQPVAVIFGGQPGAGKSVTVKAAMRELAPRGGVVRIDADNLRGYHPDHDFLMASDDKTAAFYTQRDAGRWVEKAIAEAKVQRVNLIIDGTMRDGNGVASTMDNLRAAGYEIDARVLAVNSRLSEQGILLRYEGQKSDRGAGRMTPREVHQAAYDGMPVTLERIERDKLADRLTIYRRGAEVLYSNELQAGQWTREPQARAVVEAERNRVMTMQERRNYANGFDKLAEQLARPERQASAEEIREIDGLRRQAKAELAAEVFRQESPEKAVQQHPELAPAYGYMRAREAKAEADGLNERQRSIVMARVRDNVAERIERGDVPSVQSKVEQQRDLER